MVPRAAAWGTVRDNVTNPSSGVNTPIAKSVAIKFDLYNNAGEGIDSTGEYVNGASPTTPSTDLTASGVNLHSGDIFNVHVVYNGTTLTWTITDATTAQTFTTSAVVNIPSIVGSTTAYAGFTGGTGGLTATQEILTWTLSSMGSVEAATPAITPGSETTSAPVQVSITDATTGASVYYTTDGSTPTTSSTKYSAPFTLTVSATVKALATASGFSNSAVASASYVIQMAQSPAATPVIAPAAGTYSDSVSVSITDTTSGSIIYYTTNGTTPTTGSTQYTGAFTLTTSATVQAIAVATGFTNSAVASRAYTVTTTSGTAINFANGFAGQTSLTLNGGATINGTRLRLTDGGGTEARSAFFSTPVSVTNFTSDFSFQLTNPAGDGMTFTIQGSSPTAVGPSGGGLGYGPDNVTNPSSGVNTPIAKSVAIKFDLYNNAGEGIDSTGEYVNGASPTTPSTDLTASGVNLHSGDVFNVHVVYNGTTLTWTITDATTAQTFTTSAVVNIPSIVGSATAYVGFTAATGGSVSTQEILTWTLNSGAVAPLQYETESTPVFNASHSSGPTYRIFAWTGFTNGSGTTLDGTAVGQSVSITLNVPAAGVYDVKVATKQYVTRGIVQLSVNGSNVGPAMDQYNAGEVWREFDLGNISLAAGNQTFVFTTSGKNAASSGYTQAYDYIKLTPQ